MDGTRALVRSISFQKLMNSTNCFDSQYRPHASSITSLYYMNKLLFHILLLSSAIRAPQTQRPRPYLRPWRDWRPRIVLLWWHGWGWRGRICTVSSKRHTRPLLRQGKQANFSRTRHLLFVSKCCDKKA